MQGRARAGKAHAGREAAHPDRAEGKELVELAQKKGLTLSVGHIFRFNNALAEVKRLIKEEKFFGRLFLMELTWTNLERAPRTGTC